MSARIPAEHLPAAVLWEALCGSLPDWGSAATAAGVMLAIAERHPDLVAELRRFLAWGGTAEIDTATAEKIVRALRGPAL